MTRHGKATMILVGALAGLATIVAAGAVMLQMRERDLRLSTEKALTLVKAENDDLQQRLQEAADAKEEAEADLSKVKSQFDDLAKQLLDERQAKEALAKSIDDRQREVDRLGRDLELIKSEREQLAKELSDFKGQQETLRKQLSQAEQVKVELEKQLETSSQPTLELEKVVVTNPSGGGTTASPVSATQGQVVVVNREYDFIVVNLGRNQGLQIGQEFQIVRGNEILGRAKVEKVYDELSAAAILPDSNKASIREGDLVKAI